VIRLNKRERKLNMATKYRVDPSKIDGFDGMTAEEKVKALLGYEIEADEPAETGEIVKLKKSLSNANSEAAEYKRQLREKQSEAERAEAERAEKDREREELLKSLLEEKRVSTYKAQLMTAGIDPNTADLMAKSLPDGVSDEYFAATKTFLDNQKQALLSESLNKQPGLSVGTPPTAAQAEKEAENKMRHYFGLSSR
jgi:hypothetical protein